MCRFRGSRVHIQCVRWGKGGGRTVGLAAGVFRVGSGMTGSPSFLVGLQEGKARTGTTYGEKNMTASPDGGEGDDCHFICLSCPV